MTFITIESNPLNSNIITILTNDLEANSGYHSMNPRKADVSDIRHLHNNLFVEIIFTSGVKTQYLSPTPIWIANPDLAVQGVIPVDSVGGVAVTTCQELEDELIKITA
jgi:hypothetical protein